ncbi:MAG: hypothetical protein BMS9Abin12_1477 [Acidimicrobiia bacterium]|nr:MAG: hypothetical protein BMS9Abin12_1477 [Acidimicrobiia bacterium]
MGHQSDDARKALRAYARDLHATANLGGFSSSVGTSKQGDAPIQSSGSGAPHQLAIAAAIVSVVLLGGIGIASAANSVPDADSQHATPLSAQPASVTAVFARTGSVPTNQAIQAFIDLGMTRSMNALIAAAGTGIDSSAAVQLALAGVLAVTSEKLTAHGTVTESDLDVALAVTTLEQAVRPPGLDPNRLPPGLGGTPPGQDDDFVPPGRNDLFVPPGQDNDFVPPGQDELFVPQGQDPNLVPPGQNEDKENPGGRENAPGQNKEEPGRGSGKP